MDDNTAHIMKAADLVGAWEGLEIQGERSAQFYLVSNVNDLIRTEITVTGGGNFTETFARDHLCVVRKGPKPLTLEEVIQGVIADASASPRSWAAVIAERVREHFTVEAK